MVDDLGDGFDEKLAEIESALGGAEAVSASFAAEMRQMQVAMADTGREAALLRGGISRGLRSAIDGLVKDGDSLSDALRNVGQSMIDAAYSAALRPVTSQLGGTIAEGMQALLGGLLPFKNGGSFAQGRVRPFASGGVVTAPTTFPMRGGTGLMGEAGPEAIMPLTRGADGRLGVQAAGNGGAAARPVQVVMNITTPDAQGFRRSQSQIAAEMGRALSRGNRNR